MNDLNEILKNPEILARAIDESIAIRNFFLALVSLWWGWGDDERLWYIMYAEFGIVIRRV